METIKSKYFPRAVAVALALALLTAGCAGPETVPDAEMSPSQIAAQEAERAQAEKERAPAAPAYLGKRTGAHNFSQREYTDAELDALLYTDLDELGKG